MRNNQDQPISCIASRGLLDGRRCHVLAFCQWSMLTLSSSDGDPCPSAGYDVFAFNLEPGPAARAVPSRAPSTSSPFTALSSHSKSFHSHTNPDHSELLPFPLTVSSARLTQVKYSFSTDLPLQQQPPRSSIRLRLGSGCRQLHHGGHRRL